MSRRAGASGDPAAEAAGGARAAATARTRAAGGRGECGPTCPEPTRFGDWEKVVAVATSDAGIPRRALILIAAISVLWGLELCRS